MRSLEPPVEKKGVQVVKNSRYRFLKMTKITLDLFFHL